MSFADWVKNGWLVAHKSSKQEIANLLGIVARDLKDSEAKDVSDDWRFAIAYNAGLQAATAALAAAGYRASRENHHYRVIQSLELTLGKDAKFIRVFQTAAAESRCLDNNSQRETRPHKPEVTVSKTALEHTVALL